MAGPDVYPLAWPDGWPRTRLPQNARFDTTLAQAIHNVEDEVRRLGGKNLILSSNMAGLSRAQPKDRGVAAYFTLDGESRCVPCDAWNAVEDNVQAIAKTLNALRGIERWGAKELLRAAFRGFTALEHQPSGWREVLGLRGDVATGEVHDAYRRLAAKHHPDRGGDAATMARINRARDEALKEIGNG